MSLFIDIGLLGVLPVSWAAFFISDFMLQFRWNKLRSRSQWFLPFTSWSTRSKRNRELMVISQAPETHDHQLAMLLGINKIALGFSMLFFVALFAIAAMYK